MRISHITRDSYVDGPRGPRVVLFVQGCSRGCPGCQSQHLWPHDSGQDVPTWKLARQLVETGQPITISGGEPFEQSAELVDLLEKIKQLDPHRHVIVYSGYTFETVLASPMVRALTCIDILVDGPYIAGLDHGRLQWRGSTNQRAIDVVTTLANMKLIPVVLDWDTPTLIVTEEGDLLGASDLVDELTPGGTPTRRCGQTHTPLEETAQ